MFSTIYVEDAVAGHPRTRALLRRSRGTDVVRCERYGQVFNRRAQNFRLQKRRPALILARKAGRFLSPTPASYGIGGDHNFYFSHMLNCIYDCRYCFLQGRYSSAHYVLFVNYEDFAGAIVEKTRSLNGSAVHYFSGYDCDSLALDPVTGFSRHFLPVFRELPHALLELRTKSTQVRSLLSMEPLANCVVAFSFTPPACAQALEHRVPAVESRFNALLRLQEAGWRVGLRFDPLVYSDDFRAHYRGLFDWMLARIDAQRLHSVSLGGFRMPAAYFDRMACLYPRERLFASALDGRGGMVEYREPLRSEILEFCRRELLRRLPPEKLFVCDPI